MYLSITGATPDNKLAKYQPFNTEAEAIAHAEEYNGFVVLDPEGNQSLWIVDMVAKTVTRDVAAEEAATALMTNTQYQRDRQYPAMGDQLDALFHAGVFPAEMAAEIQAVKDANPKPV